MLTIEEQAKMDWLMENVKVLLSQNGIKADTNLIDDAIAEKEAIDYREACQVCVDDARLVVATKYEAQLKDARKNEDHTLAKSIIEQMSIEAQAEEERIREEMGV